MKKQICVNVDVEALLVAQSKVPNISAYLNDCLKGLSGVARNEFKEQELKSEIDNINNSITELSIKKSISEMNLKILLEKKKEEIKLNENREQFKRWLCPIPKCEQLNLMENVICSKCQCKSRDSPKTVIKYINE